MRSGVRAVSIAAVAVALVSAATGCGSAAASSPSLTGIEAPGMAAAVSARNQVIGTLRSVYSQRLYSGRIAYATSLQGSYRACPGSGSELYYQGQVDLHPVRRHVSAAAFTHGVKGALTRDGWSVYPQKFMQAPGLVYSFGVTRTQQGGGLGGLMYVLSKPSPRAVLSFRTQCFPRPGRGFPLSRVRLALPHPAGVG